MTNWYREDLAHIHDVGHRDFVLQAAPGILTILRQSRISRGLVVDLGCGSGYGRTNWERLAISGKKLKKDLRNRLIAYMIAINRFHNLICKKKE